MEEESRIHSREQVDASHECFIQMSYCDEGQQDYCQFGK
jgi:hypothetical protein